MLPHKPRPRFSSDTTHIVKRVREEYPMPDTPKFRPQKAPELEKDMSALQLPGKLESELCVILEQSENDMSMHRG